MPESVEFSVDSSVSPVRVLAGQSDGQPPDLGVDRWATSRPVRRLCPVACDSPSMPSEHRFWFDDQKRVASASARHCSPEKTKDGSVRVGELWSVDLTLQNEELVAQCKDLCVTGVSCGECPSESVENKANQSREQGHERRRLPARAKAKTRGITGRMNFRHAHLQDHCQPVVNIC